MICANDSYKRLDFQKAKAAEGSNALQNKVGEIGKSKALERISGGARWGSPCFHPSQMLQSASFERADAAYTMNCLM